MANKALHWTAIPLRFIAASELGRFLVPIVPDGNAYINAIN